MRAIDIIHNEHRALAAVLQALRFMLDEIGAGRLKPDPDLLGHMIEYITQVPDKLHHPKEDDVLFRIMRERVPAAGSLIDKLQADHVEGARHTGQLEAALARYRSEGSPAFAAFEALARGYVDAMTRHIRLEEAELLPLARGRLSATDWAEIDAAFEANRDPWSGPTGEFRALYSQIVNLVPAPYGLG
jgi:hemerythrin-like domain-containing protein